MGSRGAAQENWRCFGGASGRLGTRGMNRWDDATSRRYMRCTPCSATAVGDWGVGARGEGGAHAPPRSNLRSLVRVCLCYLSRRLSVRAVRGQPADYF